ncbi:E3 ubiquitin-protein ligase Os04g0590900 [Cajanus cajan]|uniref:RING-type E3 ubiquitin transferase n=1 Tax=Cajanus cajan TaxID=3821 RepID=A0A151THA6_CAJCA|nr:E3 ubiquitin-protein ligase Os04g0590900 [Cajanus cajan]KYP66419.1 RING-H2 finger protein ATL3A [Cajanus cajan]
MASLGNPKSWVPYMDNKDCSQGFCSLYCPQWCYVIYPPPPPFEFPNDDSSPNFSPLVIAVIGVLASAFLLVSYYTIISKFCGSRESSQSEDHEENVELEEDHNPSLHEPWHAPTIGLDEALIKSITVCKYKKGEGLVEVTDCPVCLSEFQDDESVRLLPKCSHAFHLPCIDTWLKSHSSCPLCRASIFTFNAAALHVAAPVMELPSRSETSSQNQHADENVATRQSELDDAVEEVSRGGEVPKTALRALSDLGNLRGRHSVIEIRDGGYDSIRRTVSMDHSFQSGTGLSVGDVLHVHQEPSKGSNSRGESSKSSYRRRVLHCVLSPIAMKRSFSSGRFSLSRSGRGRQGILPV